MASLTLKDIPAQVHRKLKARAARHGRSLNSEALAVLRAALMPEPFDVDALLARAREHRSRGRGELTDDLLQEIKREGRA
jgi:plasmid stability protein